MPQLSAPTAAVAESFVAAMKEYLDEERGQAGPSSIGAEIREWQQRWEDPKGFAAYVQVLRARSDEDTPRPDGFVPETTWWWIEGPHYLGRISLRHRLTDRLADAGGHIGYTVRPGARRRGHATAMLAAVLPQAHSAGIDPVLVTSDVTNLASRKVIEANGGVLEDERHGKLRFWVPTHAAAVVSPVSNSRSLP